MRRDLAFFSVFLVIASHLLINSPQAQARAFDGGDDDGLQMELDEVMRGLADESQLIPLKESPAVAKRTQLTMDFNGMQVSYPTWIRLNRMQQKVIRLKKMLEALHRKYPLRELIQLKQYKTLMDLFESLKPLLPEGQKELVNVPHPQSYIRKMLQKQSRGKGQKSKRAEPADLDGLWSRVDQLDDMIDYVKSEYSLEDLEQMPQWETILGLRESMNQFLPLMGGDNQEQRKKRSLDDQADEGGDDGLLMTKAKRLGLTMEFDGMTVSFPEYLRLMRMKQQTRELDETLAEVRRKYSKEQLERAPAWHRLKALRKALSKFIPVPEY